MKAIVVVRRVHKHQVCWGSLFADGLRQHGVTVAVQEQAGPCDLLVLWGVGNRQAIEAQKRAGGEVCVLERAYLGNRFEWTSVSFGGRLNGRGIYRGPLTDGSRWERHFGHLMQPWQERENGPAVVMGQVPTDNAVRNVDIDGWCSKAVAEFRRQGFPTEFRPHPNIRKDEPIEATLARARFVVTWNSNSGTDAVMAGVPTVAMDEGAMCYPVAGHDLTPPPAPDRTAWAHAMAWKQFSMDEFRSGYVWGVVGT